jgi:hypothetical protein
MLTLTTNLTSFYTTGPKSFYWLPTSRKNLLLMIKAFTTYSGTIVATTTGNVRKLCRNRKLFFKVNINTVALKLTFL